MKTSKTIELKCRRYDECESKNEIECKGCGYKYFDDILKEFPDNKTLKCLGKKFFPLCSNTKHRQGQGGRPRLDEPIRELFTSEFRNPHWLTEELKVKIKVQDEIINLKIKCDGAFELNGKYIFYEIKGAGNNTNDIQSAITAAQMVKLSDEFKNSEYYYIGVSRKRDSAFDKKNRTSIYPYVKWAENNHFIEFYNIYEIEELFKDIKAVTKKGAPN